MLDYRIIQTSRIGNLHRLGVAAILPLDAFKPFENHSRDMPLVSIDLHIAFTGTYTSVHVRRGKHFPSMRSHQHVNPLRKASGAA